MIQGIEDDSIQVDSSIKADACSIEVGKTRWHVGAVERLPHTVRVKSNRWESFRESNDDDEDEDECDDVHIPAPESSDEEPDEGPSIEELRQMRWLVGERVGLRGAGIRT
eukprot:1182002-Karenia_brevis.AAC.1